MTLIFLSRKKLGCALFAECQYKERQINCLWRSLYEHMVYGLSQDTMLSLLDITDQS